VKDDQDFWWEIEKAVIANLFQTIFLIIFSVLCWFARKFILKILECCKKKEEDDERMYKV
jgi:hypothetical protein